MGTRGSEAYSPFGQFANIRQAKPWHQVYMLQHVCTQKRWMAKDNKLGAMLQRAHKPQIVAECTLVDEVRLAVPWLRLHSGNVAFHQPQATM